MYESPIQLTSSIRTEVDNEIFKAVLAYNVNVDKEELVKALKYDRDQYAKGYNDGIKEFADKVDYLIATNLGVSNQGYSKLSAEIKNLVKELEESE